MYKVILTKQSFVDLSSIVDYIENQLKNPIAANLFYGEFRSKIKSLDEFPERFTKVTIGKLNYHRVPVKNFNIYYCVDNEKHLVTIARVLYGGVDINQVAIIN